MHQLDSDFPYERRISGVAFIAEIGFYDVTIHLLPLGKKRRVPYDRLQSVDVLSNGKTRIAVRLGRDLIVPTSTTEAVKLAKSLNAAISERRSTEHRKSRASKNRPAVHPFLGGERGPGAPGGTEGFWS